MKDSGQPPAKKNPRPRWRWGLNIEKVMILLAVVISWSFISAHIIVGDFNGALVVLPTAVVTLASLALVYTRRWRRLGIHLHLLNVLLTLVVTPLPDGNNLPLTIWGIPIIPVLASLLLGLRSCIGYSVFSGTLLIAVIVQSQEFGQRIPEAHELPMWLSVRWSILVTFGTIAAFAVHRAKTRSNTYIEQSNRYKEQTKIAQRAQAAKSRLLAQMSHEIRTPMNGILGMTQYLETHVTDSTVRPLVQSMAQCAHQLMALLNRILDLSKLESGQLPLYPEQSDLGELISKVVQKHQDASEQPRIIRVDLHRKQNPAFVDAKRLEQILDELLTATAQKDAQGALSVELKCEENSQDGDVLRYQVLVRNHNARDPSASILVTSAELLSLDPLDQDARSSMDLNLNLAARLAERLGGCIAMNALKQERGSFVLHLALPTRAPPPGQDSAHQATPETTTQPILDPEPKENPQRDIPALSYWQKGLVTDTNAVIKRRLMIYNSAYGLVLSYYLWVSLSRGYQKNAFFVGFGLLMVVATLVSLWRGHAKAAALIFLGTFTGIVSGITLFNGQIFSQTAWLLNLVPVMTAQLLGIRAAGWSVLTTSLSLLIISLSMIYAPIESEFLRSSGDSLVYLSTYTGLFFLLAICSTIITQKEELYLQAGHQACAQAQAQAQAASELKAAFLQDMSHEIRTPMNGIMGIAAHLIDHTSLAPQRETLNAIDRCGGHLKILLDQIFQDGPTSDASLGLKNETFDLAQLLGDIKQLYTAQAQQKGLDIEIAKVDGPSETTFIGNSTALLQILSNLVGNAIKFSDRGKITLALVLGPTQATSPHPLRSIRIDVRDQGLGLTKNQCERIFEHYQQVESKAHRIRGGTGLGLAISRELTRSMGGELGVQSELGQGSVFSVSLTLPQPLIVPATPSPALPRANEERPPQQRRVLVVDDNEINQRVASLQLRALGCDVETASNGEVAIQLHQTQTWDLILMDLRMPVMNGLEATYAIRAQESPASRVPIVALTADGFGEQRKECLDAGMDDYLTKPFRAEDLKAVIDRHCKSPSLAA